MSILLLGFPNSTPDQRLQSCHAGKVHATTRYAKEAALRNGQTHATRQHLVPPTAAPTHRRTVHLNSTHSHLLSIRFYYYSLFIHFTASG